MSWILLLLGILEFLLPYILQWFKSNPGEVEPARGSIRELILWSRDVVNQIETSNLKNPLQRKRFAKMKAMLGKVQTEANNRGIAL